MTQHQDRPEYPSTSIGKILDAAQIEFGLQGLDSVKMQRIAKRASVSTQLSIIFPAQGASLKIGKTALTSAGRFQLTVM